MKNRANRRFLTTLAMPAAVFCALAIQHLCVESVAQSDPLLHHPAPVFVRNDLDSHRVDLAALRGRVVLLNFWATWCAPCQIEMPRFAEWQAKYKAEGLEIIGVSMDDEAAPVQALLLKVKVNYPIVMGDAKLGLQYGGVLGLPVTWLIDRKGIVRAHYKGEPDLNSMEAEIRKLLDSR
jgi:thiol-disulfide isomerase/thioredoxin